MPEDKFLKTQSWLQEIITHRGELSQAIDLAQQKMNLNSNSLDYFIKAEYGISVEHRLEIYHQGYFIRLLQCMRAEYPMLCQSFSQEWFDQVVHNYLAAHPSKFKNLNELGKNFPAFLEADRPDQDSEQKNAAFDFIITLASFERAKAEIGRSKGVESLDPTYFDKISERPFSQLHLQTADTLRLIESNFDLLSYTQNFEEKNNFQPIQKKQFLALSRVNYKFSIQEIQELEFTLLNSIQENHNLSFQEHITETQRGSDNKPLRIWLNNIAGKGFFKIYNKLVV